MDSSNLAVILAPNLLHFGDGTEKMNANTEKRIRLQTTTVHCFIENASRFGTSSTLPGVTLKDSLAAHFLLMCLRGVATLSSRQSSSHAGLRVWGCLPQPG